MSQPVTSLLPSTNHNHNPTTPPMATTTRCPMPTTTHKCTVTTTGQKTKTTIHKWRQPPTNDNKHPPEPMTARLTNDGQVPRTDTGGDYPRWVKSPLLTMQFVNTKSRCHVAVCDMATKRQTMTNVVIHHCCLFLTAQWVPPRPTFVPTHFAETQDNDERTQATSSRGEPRTRCKHATRTTMTRRGHSRTTTQQRGVTMMQGNNGAWRRQHVTTTWPGHQAEGTTTHDDQETTTTHAD